MLLNATGPDFTAVSRDLQAAARKLRLPIHILHASTVPEVEAAFAAMVELHADALVIGTDTFFNSESVLIAAQALSHTIPAMYQYREVCRSRRSCQLLRQYYRCLSCSRRLRRSNS